MAVDLITWKPDRFNVHTGSAGDIELFSIYYRTRKDEPAHFMQSKLPGLEGQTWRSDSRDELKKVADEQLAAWLTRIGVSPDPAWLPAASAPNVFASPYSDPPLAVGRDVQIRFLTTEDSAFDVEVEDGELMVSLHDLRSCAIAVLPRSDNSIKIRKLEKP